MQTETMASIVLEVVAALELGVRNRYQEGAQVAGAALSWVKTPVEQVKVEYFVAASFGLEELKASVAAMSAKNHNGIVYKVVWF
jgi:hypothetical protein